MSCAPVTRRSRVRALHLLLRLHDGIYLVMDQAELLDVANDAIILTDAHGTITYWNQGACRTYGWEKNEALGQNVHALLHTKLSGDARNLESGLKEQSHWEGDLEQVCRNGERILVASRWTSESGDPAALRLQINTDVTARSLE